MINSITTALSGLQAASRRLANSANNIANIHSTTTVRNGERVLEPFRPQRVVQTSLGSVGGVRTSLQDIQPPSVPVFDPDNVAADENGITQYPNVNLESEVVDQITAKNDFLANAKVIERSDKLLDDLFKALD